MDNPNTALNPPASLMFAAGVALAVGLALWLIKRRLAGHAAGLPDGQNSSVTWLSAMVEQTRWYAILAAAFYAATFKLNQTLPGMALFNHALTFLRHLAVVVMFIQAGLWGNWAITRWADQTFERQREKDVAQATTVGMLKMLFLLLLWAILVLAALSNFGFNITTLVAGLGIGGIAVALAIQKILGDLFSSVSIILDKPFVIGDFIIVGDVLGTVEYIGLKTTRLRSLSGEQIIMPNSDLLESRIRNYRRMKERRIVMNLGVIYQTTPEQLKRIPNIFKEIIESQTTTRFDRAHFKEFGPHSLNFEVVFWILDREYLTYIETQQKINLALVEIFKAEGIEFAYPTQTVLFENPENPNP